GRSWRARARRCRESGASCARCRSFRSIRGSDCGGIRSRRSKGQDSRYGRCKRASPIRTTAERCRWTGSSSGLPSFDMSATISTTAPRRLFINMRGVSHAVANFAFFALFPGFFVYHALLAMGLMPAYFGGLIGNLSMLIAAFCIFLSFWFLRSEFWGGLNASRLFVLAWGFYAVWGAVGAFVVVGESYGFWSVREVIAMLV